MSNLARRSSLRRRGPVALAERWSEDDRVRRRVAAGQRTALLARGKVFAMRGDSRAAEIERRWRIEGALLRDDPVTPDDVAYLAEAGPVTEEEEAYRREHPVASVKMRDTLSRWQRFRRDLRVRWIEWWELGSAGPEARRFLLRVTAPVRRVRYYARWRYYDLRLRFQLSAPGRLLWRIRRFFS